ncbi:MAG: transposase [Acidiferrobacterales bacterium]
MDTIKLWARNGDAVRQAIELGELVHLDTASEELTDEFLLFAIESGLLTSWAESFPDPRQEPEIGMQVIIGSHLAARFAGLYSMRKSGYVLRSASVLGALGYSVEVLEPKQGLSRRGTSDDKLISGDVLRKLLVKMEQQADPKAPLRMPPYEPSLAVKVRKRASRRAVKGCVDALEAEARAQRVAAQVVNWYNDQVGPSLLDYARVGKGRRIHILDTTQLEVPLETGTYECSGVVKNDDGTRSRGYKLATLRTLLDHAGLITQVGLCPIQVHDLPLCRLFLETAPVLRGGDLLLEDRGFVDGETISFLKKQRQVDVIVPLKSSMLSYKEAVQLAELQDEWQPHPSRQHQHIAFVKGIDHVWDTCQVPLNACVIRYWNRKKKALDHIVLVSTDQSLDGSWMVRHYEERPEIEQDYEQMKSGGWQLKKLSSTRYSEIVFYVATVVLSYSLYHLFCNTQAGARFADKTRQALAFEQLRSRRTHIIAYAGGYFEIFETLSFVHFVLQQPASVQDRLRHWLDEHLHTVIQRE